MELFKLFGKILVDGSEAKKEIDETTEHASESSGKLGSIFGAIGKGALAVGGTVVAGIGAAATGIGALTKSAMQSYADYEQLVGGVETLFGTAGMSAREYYESVGGFTVEAREKYLALDKAQNIVFKNSAEAYKTAGLSANEYMEQVTSFSASMIASLNGDTVAAAEKSNQAIIDMSDNANKMGTSMEAIQNAYNGFAKQNYTMLDNLKLGYGGTKEEMKRLLDDANKINAEQGIMTNYSIENFGDIADAIHVVQTKMGITGTTAKEAATTISGSLGMMKSAWSNLISGMAQDDADFGQLVQDVIDSALTVFDNIAPRLMETIPRIVDGLILLINGIIPYINPLMEQLLPPLLEGAVKLIMALITNLPQLCITLGTALWGALVTMFDTIGQKLPSSVTDNFSRITEGFQLVWDMCKTVWESIGKPVFDLVMDIVKITVDWFTENFGSMSDIVSNCFESIKGFWEEHLKPCFEAIGNFLQVVLFPAFEFIFKNNILPLIKDVFEQIGRIWNSVLKPIFTGIIDFITGIFTLNWSKALSGLLNIGKGIVNGIISIIEVGINAGVSAINVLLGAISDVASAVGHLIGLDPVNLRIGYASLPRLEKGGFLEKGQMGLLEGNGDEAVVPLAKNSKGIELIASRLVEAMPQQTDNTVIQEKMNDILEKLDALLERNIYLNNDVLVGQLAPAMDTALGTIYEGKGRGGRSTW